MAQRFLTIGENGSTVQVEAITTSTGSADAGKLLALNEDGELDPGLLPADKVETIRDVVAFEAIAANSLVNIFYDNDATTHKARYADASNIDTFAVGYVTEAVASGGTARVYLSGELTVGSIANTVNELYLTDTPGQAGPFSMTTALADEWKLCQLVARRTGANVWAFIQGEAARL
jgi:hypothetical protein